MPKDYQEEERIVEELCHAVTKYGYNDEFGYYQNWFDGVREIIKPFMTTYGNARVEEIIKIAEGLSKDISDPYPFDNGYTYTPFVPLTDLIKAIKK